MGEKAKKIGDKLEGFGEKLFERFGWGELTRDEQIICNKSTHKNESNAKKETHGVDIFHKYYDPYKNQNIGIITECKNYQWQSINQSNMQKWFNQLLDTIECSQINESMGEYTSQCDGVNTGILLIHANDGKYNEEEFRKYLNQLKYPSKRCTTNIFIASNKEIEKWDSMFEYIEKKFSNEKDKFGFYYPSILQSNLEKFPYITLTQLYSSYIFADNETEVSTSNYGQTIINTIHQKIIFSFDKIGDNSFQYLLSMFRELQLQSANEYIFCFYPESKEDVEQINDKFKKYVETEFNNNKSEKLQVNMNKVKIHILDNRRLSPVDTK